MREIKTTHFRFFVAPLDVPGQDAPSEDRDKFGCYAKLNGVHLNRAAPYLMKRFDTEAKAEIALRYETEKFLAVFKNYLVGYIDEAKELIEKIATTPDQLTEYRVANPNEDFLAHKVYTTSIREAQRQLKNILDNTLLDQPNGWYTLYIGEIAVGNLDYTRFQRYEYHVEGPDGLRLVEPIWATDILQAEYPLKELLDSKPHALEGVYLLYHGEQLVTAITYRRDKSDG